MKSASTWRRRTWSAAEWRAASDTRRTSTISAWRSERISSRRSFSRNEAAGARQLIASGTSCTEQLHAGFERTVLHPIELLASMLRLRKPSAAKSKRTTANSNRTWNRSNGRGEKHPEAESCARPEFFCRVLASADCKLQQAAGISGGDDVRVQGRDQLRFAIAQSVGRVGLHQIVDAGRAAADRRPREFPPAPCRECAARSDRGCEAHALRVLQVAGVVIGDAQRQRISLRARFEFAPKIP